MARQAAPPPDIPGFTPVRLIDVGGYADVFLYEQHMPQRQVAVKVLIPDAIAGDSQRRQFTAEANLMASVSAHPYIVSVFQAAIAADGRPYIVMEYYPGANLLKRVRTQRFSPADALRTGIHIASAVETAHRAGILHRDIKPANILTSEYGRPGLTDFGIAAPDEQTEDDQAGLSIPWAPPEAFQSDRLDERADVYSLAATVYHLLAGRSPYELSGQPNTPLDLMNRIERSPLPTTGRPDVPGALERVLAQALAKDPSHRPRSAAEFGRLLQGVEAEMRLAVTQLELAESGVVSHPSANDEAEDATRVRGITTIDAQSPNPDVWPTAGAIQGVPERPTVVAPLPERRREGLLAEPEVEATMARPVAKADVPAAAAPQRRTPILVGGAVAVVAAVVALVIATSGGDGPGESDTTVPVVVNDGFDAAAAAVAPGVVTDLLGTANADGTFSFTWSPPESAPSGVRYQVTEQATADRPRIANPPQDTASFVSAVACVDVVAIAANIASPPLEGCVTP